MNRKIYLLITGTAGILNEPRAFATEKARGRAFDAYCKKSGASWDDCATIYDLSSIEEFAACFTLDAKTLKIT